MRINVTKLIEKTKQRHKLYNFARHYGLDYQIVLLKYAKYSASLIKQIVKKYVKQQRVGHTSMKQLYPPLSKAYKKRKLPKSRDKFWVNTGWLIDHVSYWKYRDVYVGYPTYITYKNKRIKAGQLALWLEKGTRYIPARPLFRYALKTWIGNIDMFTNKFIELYKKDLGLSNKK